MRRRTFIAGLGSAAAWPIVARAHQAERVRRVGILAGSPTRDAFKQGLAKLGWTEGRNLRFEERWADKAENLPAVAAELARLAPDAIFAVGSPPLRAMQRATSEIPIVFAGGVDPVDQGFVSSLAHPGGNITGFAFGQFPLATKQLDLLKKLAPNLERVADLYDPADPPAAEIWAQIEAAAPLLKLEASNVPVRSADDIEHAIAALAREPNGGLLVGADAVTGANRKKIAMLALRHRLPAMYQVRYYVESGGLASYGPDIIDLSRGAASYVDRILKGEKPSNLPVVQPTEFTFVINLKIARALGIEVPPTLLAIADEVIE